MNIIDKTDEEILAMANPLFFYLTYMRLTIW